MLSLIVMAALAAPPDAPPVDVRLSMLEADIATIKAVLKQHGINTTYETGGAKKAAAAPMACPCGPDCPCCAACPGKQSLAPVPVSAPVGGSGSQTILPGGTVIGSTPVQYAAPLMTYSQTPFLVSGEGDSCVVGPDGVMRCGNQARGGNQARVGPIRSIGRGLFGKRR